MRSRISLRAFVCLVALFATLTATRAAAQRAMQTPVPAGLLIAAQAHQEPLGFAMSLSDAGIPNGLATRGPAQWPRSKPVFNLPRASTVPLRQVIEEFNKFHANYQAVIMDGVVVVRPMGPRTPYLDSPSKVKLETVTGLSRAERRIFAGLAPRLDTKGGIAGSGDAEGEFSGFVLDGRGHHVVEVLNQLAKQSRCGWLVETAEDNGRARVAAFGLVREYGSTTRIKVE